MKGHEEIKPTFDGTIALELELDSERRKLRNSRIILLPEDVNSPSAQRIVEDLEILSQGNLEPIALIISSKGGDAFSGLAIMRAIQRVQAKGIKVIGQVHGHAMSMAFFILQCCDERVMGKYDILMCHGITTFSIGDMKDLEAENKLMRKFQEDFANLISKRCTADNDSECKEDSFWHAVLESNTPQFYDDKEALEMGLIDKVE